MFDYGTLMVDQRVIQCTDGVCGVFVFRDKEGVRRGKAGAVQSEVPSNRL